MTTTVSHIVSRTMKSPIGTLTLAGQDGILTHLRMEEQTHAPVGQDEWRNDPRAFPEVAEQLRAYFAGELTAFDVPLQMDGTDFQLTVWEGLQTIPYGCTMSYGELAGKIGNGKASRAVGLANGRNPIAIIVPCHRVISTDGTLTGFGGGLDRKKWLLDHEMKHAGR